MSGKCQIYLKICHFLNRESFGLATSSHEKQCFIYPENDNEASRIKDIEGLRIQELEDLTNGSFP